MPLAAHVDSHPYRQRHRPKVYDVLDGETRLAEVSPPVPDGGMQGAPGQD